VYFDLNVSVWRENRAGRKLATRDADLSFATDHSICSVRFAVPSDSVKKDGGSCVRVAFARRTKVLPS
jgi:hypothetical protein